MLRVKSLKLTDVCWGDGLIITNVEKDTDRAKSYSVFVDGELSFKVREQELFKLGIYQGRELTNQELDLLKHQAQISLAKAKVLSFISVKSRTVHEVSEKLKEEFTTEVINEVIAILVENGYLDDKLYVEKFITEKKRLSNLSSKAIRYELMKRGVSLSFVDEKLNELKYDEKEYAKKLLEKRSGRIGNDSATKMREHLFRKGFSTSTIEQVLLELREGD